MMSSGPSAGDRAFELDPEGIGQRDARFGLRKN